MLRIVGPRYSGIASLSSNAGFSVEKRSKNVEGWVKSIQKRGKIVFLKVGDNRKSEQTQVVIPKELARGIRVGSSVCLSGIWESSKGEQQEMELIADQCFVYSMDSNPRYDIPPDALRKAVHLRARAPEFSSIMRSRSRIFLETHRFFGERNFVHIETPKLTRNDCEGGGEVFDVCTGSPDGNNKFYLTVSSQLHLEAMIGRLANVYTLGPAFRAEKQQSHAHLCEFNMLEAEMAFIKTVDEVCDIVEDYVKSIIRLSLDDEKLKNDMESVGRYRSEIHPIAEDLCSKWTRIEFEEAVKILEGKGEKVSAKSGLSKKNELALVNHFGMPCFVTHFPAENKPFYMARDGKKSLSFDLLVPNIGELAGGSVREIDAEELERRGCDIEWYLELRRRGQPPSAGFGIGFERLLQYILGIHNIKDTIAFPRWYEHCQC